MRRAQPVRSVISCSPRDLLKAQKTFGSPGQLRIEYYQIFLSKQIPDRARRSRDGAYKFGWLQGSRKLLK